MEVTPLFQNDNKNFNLTMNSVTLVEPSNDHRMLSNRDASNQHPISSITGLSSSLSSVEQTNTRLLEEKLDISSLNEFSNLEIQTLWNQLIT